MKPEILQISCFCAALNSFLCSSVVIIDLIHYIINIVDNFTHQ